MIGWEETVLRIVVGALLGGFVGLEREMRGQAAGFRTHTLVAMGSTLFTLVSLYGVPSVITGDLQVLGEPLGSDPSRIASQIVVGIGFLGAGAIMRHGTSVKGLTTAASLWVVAAMGLSVGAGYWVGAISVSVMLLIVLRGLRPAENLLTRWIYPDEAMLIIRLGSESDASNFEKELERHDIRVREISMVQTGENYTELTIGIRLARSASALEVVDRIGSLPGVDSIRWER